jgi:adenylosuccinate lyase
MNTRSCERVNGLGVILRGYLSMVSELAGDQWNEGDVSCSVVRRVALPDGFYAIDGLMGTLLSVLDDFGAFPGVIEVELDRYLPFLSTTKILMAATRAGMGREQAHEMIKKAAVAAALKMRDGEANTVLADLGADPDFPLDTKELVRLVESPLELTGAARQQVGEVVELINTVVASNSDHAYRPASRL